MANEHRGDFSELALIRALEVLGYRYGRNLHWRSTPARLQVCESDVTLGPDPADPEAIFQVCSSGHEGGYHKKFWRDLGELFEVRAVFPRCRVVSVLFEPGAKPKLLDVYRFVSDGVIQVSAVPGGARLLSRIAAVVAGRVPTDSGRKYELARAELTGRSVTGLASAVRAALARPLADWQLNHTPAAPHAADDPVNVRKAILTAALFASRADFGTVEPFLQAGLRQRPLPPAPFLPALRDLGVCRPSLRQGEFLLADSNLLRTLRQLGVPTFTRVAAAATATPGSRLFAYVDTVQRLPRLIPYWFEAIRSHYPRLCGEGYLAGALAANFHNHHLLLPAGVSGGNEPWLFRRLLDLVRAADGKCCALGMGRFDPVFRGRGLRPLRFHAPEYVAGRRPLSGPEAAAAASVLAPELVRVRPAVAPGLLDRFAAAVRRSEFNQRLLTYRGVDPLPVILRERFGFEPTTLVPPVAVDLGISRAATCEGHVAGGTVSMWQGASRFGVAHKVKELVGRMGLCCLTAQPGADGGRTFRYRAELPNRVLYTDGDWGDRELRAVLAGCFTAVHQVM